MGGLSAKLKVSGNSKEKEPKLIVVFGATGGQGGSVARALHDDPDFKVRAITRNPESEKAKALAEKGAEVIAADQDDLESLTKALEGAYGVYAVTNYWEHTDGDREIKQGKNIADACKANNVKHLVFSGLESVKDAIDKECTFFDTKATIEEYMKKEACLNVTSVRFSFFCENFLGVNKPRKDEDNENTYILDIPLEGKPIHCVPVSETGECTHQIFKHSKKYIGKTIGYSSYEGKVEDYAEILTKHLEGKTFKAGEMTVDQFRGLEFPGAEHMGNMYEAVQKGKLHRDISATKALNPTISDFDTWVQTNKDKLLAALD